MTDSESLRRLRDARGFVLDMDGTLVLGDHTSAGMRALPGAVELTTLLGARATPFVVLTNGTNQTAARYAASLRKAGLSVSASQMLTPVESVLAVSRRRGHRRVMVLGTGSIFDTLGRGGIEVLPAEGKPAAVDAVFVGWFRDLRFSHLEAACHAVWGGARLYSASQALFYATADGKTLGTSRPICAAIRDLTGRRVELVGKPSRPALTTAADRLGCPRTQLAVIGDDPLLEPPMARRAGALAVAVHSGIGSAADFAKLGVRDRPQLSFPCLADVARSLAEGSSTHTSAPNRRGADHDAES